MLNAPELQRSRLPEDVLPAFAPMLPCRLQVGQLKTEDVAYRGEGQHPIPLSEMNLSHVEDVAIFLRLRSI